MSVKTEMTGPKGNYARPSVRVYGDMKHLTAGGSGNGKEVGTNPSKKIKA